MLLQRERDIIQPKRERRESIRSKMIKSIKIEGYRGFSEFEMRGLGRVNLLVGTNNSGKTSALEAIYLLASQGDPLSLWKVLARRSERLPERPTNSYPDLDVSHLFNGHELHLGSQITLTAENQAPGRMVHFTVVEVTDEQRPKTPVREGVPIASRIGLQVKGRSGASIVIPLSRLGGF